jgi:hypothetical protein
MSLNCGIKRLIRSALILIVVLLHFGVYRLVNNINAVRSPIVFHDFSTSFDAMIPYLAWTWIIYYGALPYTIIMGAIVAWQLSSSQSLRAMAAFAIMIIAGGALQLIFPAHSPWPANVCRVQSFFHTISFDPFVCLPSMHVSLVTLTAALSTAVFRSFRTRAIQISVAFAISLSTLTLKEHYALDAIAGILLAAIVYLSWRYLAADASEEPQTIDLVLSRSE